MKIHTGMTNNNYFTIAFNFWRVLHLKELAMLLSCELAYNKGIDFLA